MCANLFELKPLLLQNRFSEGYDIYLTRNIFIGFQCLLFSSNGKKKTQSEVFDRYLIERMLVR